MSGQDLGEVTKKQRFWLDHLAAWGRGDQNLAGYAASHDLDRQRLYNWKTRLRKLGLLDVPAKEPSSRDRSPVGMQGRRSPVGDKKTPVRFSRVHLAGGEGQGPTFRIRFPNGVILETTSPGCSLPDRGFVSYLASLP